MNIERYTLPVIIAAGLHGALLLSFVDPVVIFPPGKTKTTPVEPPVERIQMIPDTPASGSESTGGPAPVLELPDILTELPKDTTVFTVPVKDTIVPIKPLTELPKIPEGFGNPGDGKGLRDGPPGVISSIKLDRAPRATVQRPPGYPGTMRSTNGSVTVEFIVDTAGRVVTAEAVHWTHRDFVDLAVRAVLLWRFEPGTIGGRKVSFRMAVPIEFNAER